MDCHSMKNQKKYKGSALVMVVVLTSLLAVIGTVFVLMSRMDMRSALATESEAELNMIVESVISVIKNQLAADCPGLAGQEYYDYPDSNNRWLASLVPNWTNEGTDPCQIDDDNYHWKQISDVTGFLAANSYSNVDVNIDPTGPKKYVLEYPVLTVNASGVLDDLVADADGDGIVDAKWIELDNIKSLKGKPIYAAMRIIDNSAMLNVNTAYKFDPAATEISRIDGSSQTQIDLDLGVDANDINSISSARSGVEMPTDVNLIEYQNDVIWQIESDASYAAGGTVFDQSDELDLRTKFVLQSKAKNRLKEKLPNTLGKDKETSYRGGTFGKLGVWGGLVTLPDPSAMDSNFPDEKLRRHWLTTHNFDRIIAGDGKAKFGLNVSPAKLVTDADCTAQATNLYEKMSQCIEPSLFGEERDRLRAKFAQLAVNLVDTRDNHQNVCSFDPADDGKNIFYYGIEPYPSITEAASAIDGVDPGANQNFFALELFNSFTEDVNLADFELVLTVHDTTAANNVKINNAATDVIELKNVVAATDMVLTPDEYLVLYNEDVGCPFAVTGLPNGSSHKTNKLRLADNYTIVIPGGTVSSYCDTNNLNVYNVSLRRIVDVNDGGTISERKIYLDRVITPNALIEWIEGDGGGRHYGKNIDLSANHWWHVNYPFDMVDLLANNLGSNNNVVPVLVPLPKFDLTMPLENLNGADGKWDLATVADLVRLLAVGPAEVLAEPFDMADLYGVNQLSDMGGPNGKFKNYVPKIHLFAEKIRLAYEQDFEDLIRINLANPYVGKLFNYVTVFDPANDGIDNDGDGNIDENDPAAGDIEWKLPGKININTANWYVISKLPWVTEELAKAIVAYRDKSKIMDVYHPNTSPVVSYAPARFNAINSEIDARFSQTSIKENAGFEGVAELSFVLNKSDEWDYSIAKYANKVTSVELDGYPDLTTASANAGGDGAINDFDQRDVILSRISNLISVRSDCFTAYVLVRIGLAGPQKRYLIVLDRTNIIPTPTGQLEGEVHITAIKQLPDSD